MLNDITGREKLPYTVIDIDPETLENPQAGSNRFYPVATGRRMISSVAGMMYDQLSLAGRRVARTEPFATMFMRRYVRDQDVANAQWMIDNGMRLQSWHGQLARQAAVNGDHAMLTLLIRNRPCCEFMEALYEVSPDALRQLIKNEPLRLSGEHYPLVVRAASAGQIRMVRCLVAAGAPAFCQGEGITCTSALLSAASNGHRRVFKYLVKAGALKSLLTHDFVQSCPVTVRFLLKFFHPKLDKDFYHLAVSAARRGDADLLALLVSKGVPISRTSDKTASASA